MSEKTIPEEIPLSYEQQVLRFLDFVNPHSTFTSEYIIGGRYRILGRLDHDVLRRSLVEVIKRHDALRTTPLLGDGMPVQHVHHQVEPTLSVRQLDESEYRDSPAINEFFARSESAKIDLREPPLLWLTLGQVSPDDHLVSIVVHHTICDVWSLGLILADLGRHYDAFARGTDLNMPLPPQHSDYVRNQQRKHNAYLDSALEYWRRTLEGVMSCGLPIECKRSGLSTVREMVWIAVESTLAQEVEVFARSTRTTQFMTLLAAFKVFLHAETKLEDLAVPTLQAGRTNRAVFDLVGFLINAIVMRTQLSGSQTFIDVLTNVRRTCIDAYEHEVPIVVLGDEIPDVPMLLSDEDRVLPVFQYLPLSTAEPTAFGPHCVLQPVAIDAAGSEPNTVSLPLDMLVTAIGRPGSLKYWIAFDPTIVSRTRVEEAAQKIVNTLRVLVSSPNLPLRDVVLAV